MFYTYGSSKLQITTSEFIGKEHKDPHEECFRYHSKKEDTFITGYL